MQRLLHEDYYKRAAELDLEIVDPPQSLVPTSRIVRELTKYANAYGLQLTRYQKGDIWWTCYVASHPEGGSSAPRVCAVSENWDLDLLLATCKKWQRDPPKKSKPSRRKKAVEQEAKVVVEVPVPSSMELAELLEKRDAFWKARILETKRELNENISKVADQVVELSHQLTELRAKLEASATPLQIAALAAKYND